MNLSISKCFLFFVIMTLTVPLTSQAPYAFNYQALARNSEGDPLSDQQISVLITVISGSVSGDPEFQEEHIVTTNERGLFSIQVGAGTFFQGNLRNIDWGNDLHFIRTEIDPNGGEDYVDMGIAQLYSVPYALYAAEAGNASGGADAQRLSLSGTTLTIENGNSVDLSSLSDGVIDADSDPTNELQNMSISGNQLTLSQGNSIDLSNIIEGGSDQFWSQLSTGIVYDGDFVSLVNNDFRFGVNMSVDSRQNGTIATYDPGGSKLVEIGENELAGNLKLNFIGQNLLEAGIAQSGEGMMEIKGTNGNVNFRASGGSNSNLGNISTFNEAGNVRASVFVNSSAGNGDGIFRGPNGRINARSAANASNFNHGFVSVHDADGDSQAGIYVDQNNRGRVFADFMDIIVTNAKSESSIVYSTLHGPESAAYLRGTSTLKDGVAEIKFPSHFTNAINAKGMTVMISPLSDRSKGIAVIKKGQAGFRVKELFDGSGNYDFDWEVKGVRAGAELYKVNRPIPRPVDVLEDISGYKSQTGN